MKRFLKITSLFITVVLVVLCFAGCANMSTTSSDIVILFTGNVGNAATDGVGYSGVASYKADLQKNHNLVATVDLGNSLSGGNLDLVSSGEYAVEIMNEVGYDYYVPGVKDAKLNLDRLSETFNSKMISSTLSYTGDSEFEIAHYINVNFSGTTVGLVGVTAPGENTEKFSLSDDAAFVQNIRDAVKESKEAGADYIVLLANVPAKTVDTLAQEVEGVTAILNAAKTCAQRIIERADGSKVIYSSCDKKLKTIGQLMITSGGTVSTSIVTTKDKDEDTDLVINKLNDEYNKILAEPAGSIDYNLPINNETGIRIVRNRETAIGDFIADAYRAKTEADIAFVSADEIKTDIKAGQLKLSDLLSVLPSKNTLTVVNLTGAQIADILEYSVQKVQTYFASFGQPLGEFEGFLQVSGISFNVSTYTKSAVVLTEDGKFDSLAEVRRVSQIKVLNSEGVYEAIDPLATYTVAGTETLLKGLSNGNTLAGTGVVKIADAGLDYEAVLDYIKGMENSKITGYEKSAGRIVIM